MSRVVQKFGGSSVADATCIARVANRVARSHADGDELVVVVSAMGDTTDRLVAMAHELNQDPSAREMDMLLSAGETISAALVSMALAARGIDSVALSGAQAGIRTSDAHRTARITGIDPSRVESALLRGRVCVVAGFQGITEAMDVTTLGRGGSDTSAVALAVATGAERCEIYTDVLGVYTADPRICRSARLLPRVNTEEMLELAALGARVLHPRCVEIAEIYGMPLWVRSSFDEGQGTLITRETEMETIPRVRGIAHDSAVAKITLLRVADRPGIVAALFGALGRAHVNVDMIVQNVSHAGTTDVSFTIAESDLRVAEAVVADLVPRIGADGYEATANIGKVSIVGTGLRGAPGVFATAFQALADASINVLLISTSEIRLTCVVDRAQLDDAVRALHRTFLEATADTSAGPG